jgi:hypothetical protein
MAFRDGRDDGGLFEALKAQRQQRLQFIAVLRWCLSYAGGDGLFELREGG